MGQLNPEIQEQLDKLADLCCDCIQGNASLMDEQVEPLLRSLLMSGFVRNANASLQVEIESRVKKKCQEAVISRGGALTAMTQKLQDKLKRLATWESKKPEDFTASRPANISSGTDS